MEPHGAEAAGHRRLFHRFPINIALDYKGEGPRCKLQSGQSRQHDLRHLVSLENRFQF